ncbi:MAG TPA: ABC transporter ATP-binding protein [Candidatus Paceibacterota bacterium]
MSYFLFSTKTKNGTRLSLVIKYLKIYRREVVFLSALSLISAFFHAITPYFAGNIIDGLLNQSREYWGFILPLAPAFFFFGLWITTQIIVNALDWYLSVKNRYLDVRIHADYVVAGVSHLLELPLSYHKEKKMGDIQNRIDRAANNLSSLISDITITLLPQFLSIFISLVVTLLIKPLLAVLLIISTVAYLLIIIKAGPLYSAYLRKMHRAYNRAYGDAYDSVMNAQSVKQANAERYEKKRLYRNFHLKAMKYWSQMNYIWQTMNSAQRVLVMLTQGLVYMLSIYFISRGEMTIGQLVMFNGYVALFLGPFAILSNNWHIVQNGLAGLERAERVLQEKTEDYNNENSIIRPDITGKIEFRNIVFTYGKKQKTVMKDISFIANPGEVVALVGESGVGKSTMMDLLSRFFDPTEGKILIDDHDIQSLNLRFLRSKIAVVPQEILLFNDTVRNNIRYGSFDASDKKVEEAARAAHADQFIDEFPKKYKQIVGERGVKLSTGQKQRIAIARAVLRDPRILILDEPTSALDARSEQFVEEALRKLMNGRTTFIIAHRLSTVRHADKILVLEKGMIVEQGAHDELVKIENGVYRKLYELQVGLRE